MAFDDEQPQQKIDLPAYRISKYLITNAQYDAFVRDGGYTAKRWRACWTAAGLKWKGDRSEPEKYRRRLRPAEPSGGGRDLV